MAAVPTRRGGPSDFCSPIAQSDMATYAKAASYNADMRNQFAKSNVDSGQPVPAGQSRSAREGTSALISRETQRQITTLNTDLQRTRTGHHRQQRCWRRPAGIRHHEPSGFCRIQRSNNNANMDSATRPQAIASIWRDVRTQLG